MPHVDWRSRRMSPISFLAGWLAGVIEKSRLYCHYTEFWLCMLIVIFDCCFGLCVVTWLHSIRFQLLLPAKWLVGNAYWVFAPVKWLPRMIVSEMTCSVSASLTLLEIYWIFTEFSGNFLAEFMCLLLIWLQILVFHSVPVENISQQTRINCYWGQQCPVNVS